MLLLGAFFVVMFPLLTLKSNLFTFAFKKGIFLSSVIQEPLFFLTKDIKIYQYLKNKNHI
ncbi:hypothetical protein MFUM_620001 [Methylacidiphilum fumariolicum SolV]|uniref:Uncharacterized protein n=2 Tax=Candidatus Methylacidiphilum fumarolicum TaxID=591154 RepID=I0JYK7_METFB|nr:hypothetical protein A7D33_11240 [Candidatus Methylacidiphilum fumarolicum]CAI9086002.1 conserved protein of unknown function [Candidatus Methylacidiphilum fumarolicum]CCG92326.1 hypothetical protein MFUM_620001 [Methylacidiphilum fumariolicum SolV]